MSGVILNPFTTAELLRRMVLRHNDGFSQSIGPFLEACGVLLPSGWVSVKGCRLTVYCGGQEPDEPVCVQQLIEHFGGEKYIGSNPTDRGWYEWTWEADVV